MQPFIQRNRVLVVHLSFWCVYFSFFFYQITFNRYGQEPDYRKAFLDAITQILFMAIASYLNYFYWIPRFLKHKHIGKYLLEFFIPFLVIVFVHLKVKQLIYVDLNGSKHFLHTTKFILQHFAISLFIVIFVGMLKFAEDWFELEAKRKQIENEKLTAELTFLKAQINPHFLFNTLNNLYYLAFTNSPNTTEVIAKLSQMMRYMIYDSNNQKVLLSKEIEYIENYISLEKLRLNNEVPINFTVAGSLNQVEIVPLILITFLENAFKHGVSNNSTDAFIFVKLSVDKNRLVYTVENSKLPKNDHEKSGIGLQNVGRRLALSYPDKYVLEVENTYQSYKVSLSLELTK
ncbi:MAG: histidine kinase [Arcicella sp.]|jgi:LytS/YehU family sensor histidine kinase|nr:histidine kinase [Arcicella sp.]